MNSSPNSDRSRLARELHDGLAQELVAIGYKLDSVIGRETLDQNSRTELRRLRSTITGLIDQVRNEIFELRNNSDQSFTESTKSQLETLLTGTEITYQLQGQCEVSKDDKYDLIRCIRELILNSISHSNCTKIELTLSEGLIIYSDDGAFSEKNSQSSFGLIGISERIARLGGELNRNDSTFTIKLPKR
jgi:NarL family two-component system sensor histidine kinase LiaS